MHCGGLAVQAQRLTQAAVGSMTTDVTIRRISEGFVIKGDSTKPEITRRQGFVPRRRAAATMRAGTEMEVARLLAREHAWGPLWAEAMNPLGRAHLWEAGGDVMGIEMRAGRALPDKLACSGVRTSQVADGLPAAQVLGVWAATSLSSQYGHDPGQKGSRPHGHHGKNAWEGEALREVPPGV